MARRPPLGPRRSCGGRGARAPLLLLEEGEEEEGKEEGKKEEDEEAATRWRLTRTPTKTATASHSTVMVQGTV